MIKAILLAAFVPFLTQHRNITPSNEVSTCFYGSVTGIVDNAYIAAASMSPVGVTNIANAVVASSNLCTVAAARAMTNGLLKASYPNYSGPSEALYWNGSTLSGQMCNLQVIDGDIKTSYGYFDATQGWGHYRAGGSQTLPQYIKQEIESASITNGGAKAWANSKFLPLSGGGLNGMLGFTNDYGLNWGFNYLKSSSEGPFEFFKGINHSLLYPDNSQVATSNMVESVVSNKINSSSLIVTDWNSGYGKKHIGNVLIDGYLQAQTAEVNSFTIANSDAPNIVFSNYGSSNLEIGMFSTWSEGDVLYFSLVEGQEYIATSILLPDDSPVATSNMVESVIASKPAPSPLTGKTYDFDHGSNFTLRVYAALTNVIQTLGGTVTNPPAFN